METNVKKLRELNKLRESEGVTLMLTDPSLKAGFRFGHTFDLIVGALGAQTRTDYSEEKKENLILDALKTGEAYFGGNHTLFPLDFTPLEIRNYVFRDSNDPVDVLESNCVHTLNNLNRHAKEFVSAHTYENRGISFSLVYGHLIDSLRFSQGRHFREPKIRSSVDSLNKAFEYVCNVSGQDGHFLEFIASDKTRTNLQKLFEGYKEARKVNGAYCSEANVEHFCRSREIIILNRDNPAGIQWYGRSSPMMAIRRN